MLHVLPLLVALALPQDPKPKAAKPAPSADAQRELKEKALAGKPVDGAEIDSAIQRGIVLLLAEQESLDPANESKREWPYEGVYRAQELPGKPPVIPLGYRVGGTSIAAIALIEASAGKPRPEVREALERALGFVLEKLEDPLLNDEFLHGYDVRGWGHAYGLAFLLRARDAQDRARGAAHGGRHGDPRAGRAPGAHCDLRAGRLELRAQQGPDARRALDVHDRAHAAGPLRGRARRRRRRPRGGREGARDAGVRAAGDGAFQYGTNPEHKTGKGIEEVAGSIGRSPVCEVTLYLAGRGSVERIRSSIEDFFAHWEWLEVRRRQNQTHIPPYMIAPYFYFYAHRYVAQAIEFLPEAERPALRERLTKLLWAVREEDGGWNDRVFPRSENFGTAMTLLALVAPRLAAPAGWTTTKEK